MENRLVYYEVLITIRLCLSNVVGISTRRNSPKKPHDTESNILFQQAEMKALGQNIVYFNIWSGLH